MGSQWVDGGPSWGSIGNSIVSGITGAPATALGNIGKAEQIKALRAEALRKEAEHEAARTAGDAAAAAILGAPMPMSTQNVPGPMVGDPTNPIDTAGIPRADVEYLDPAVVERLKTERPFFAATARAQAYKNPAELPNVYARGRVGVSGVPDDPAELNRLRFLSKGDIDRSKPDNYVAVDSTTGNTLKILGAGDGTFAADGRTRLKDLAPPGSVVMKAGDTQLNAKPRTMFDDNAAMQNALIDASVRIKNGVVPDAIGTQKLAYALSLQHPAINKVMQDAIGNSRILHDFVETRPPDALSPLLAHIARTMYPPPAAPPPVTDPATGVVTAAPPVAAATVPPIYDPSRKQTSTILSTAPASAAELQAARALGMTRDARGNIETMMGVKDDANGNPVIPPGAYVPNWISQAILDKAGPSMVVGLLNNVIDPQAMEYLTNARAWIEPVLRIASGAVTPPNEVANYMQMFIPNANDSDTLKAQKLTRMRIWEKATSTAASANDAINMILADPKTDPEARAAAEKMRVRASEAGTLTVPTGSLGGLGSARGTAAVTASPPPPAPRSRITRPNAVNDADAIVGLPGAR